MCHSCSIKCKLALVPCKMKSWLNTGIRPCSLFWLISSHSPDPGLLAPAPPKYLHSQDFHYYFAYVRFFFFNFTILEVTLQQISKCFIRVFFFTVSPQNKIFLNRYQFFDNMWHLLMVLIFTFCVFMRLYQFLHIYCQFVFLWKIVHFFYF